MDGEKAPVPLLKDMFGSERRKAKVRLPSLAVSCMLTWTCCFVRHIDISASVRPDFSSPPSCHVIQ